MSRYRVRAPTGEVYGPVEMEVMARWASEGRVPPDATLIDEQGAESPAIAHDRLRPILQAPPTRPGPVANAAHAPPVDSGITSLIPYNNPPALVGYYVSVASLIPVFALLAGPAAIILGVAGVKKRNAEPRCKGMAHAIVAIVLGSLTTLANVGVIFVLVMSGSR